MASAKYYMVYVELKETSTNEQLQEKMNLANDWYRIKPDLWIVYSTSTPSKWYDRLGSLVKEEGRLFISELNVNNRQGWMVKGFWEWLKSDK